MSICVLNILLPNNLVFNHERIRCVKTYKCVLLKVYISMFWTFNLVFIKGISNGLQYGFQIFQSLKTFAGRCFMLSCQGPVEVVLDMNGFSWHWRNKSFMAAEDFTESFLKLIWESQNTITLVKFRIKILNKN